MIESTFQRLLKYPHSAVFDKSAVPELAFRLRHASSASWKVAEGVLQVTVGATVHSYSLGEYTVAGLAAALLDDGFEVLSVSQVIADRSAWVLVEGEGDQAQSNGDRLYGFTSLLWALLSSYSGEVGEAKRQVQEALRQMIMTQAEGEWVDLWGMLYNTPRRPGETDAAYAVRIPKEAFRLRVNARAIELAIRDATGWDVRIEEPWQNIFKLDESVLSGPDKFYDGNTVGFHLIKPTSKQYVDWDAVLKVIHRNRAAGVIVLPPETTFNTWIDGTEHYIASGTINEHDRTEQYEDRALLDYSTIEEVSVLNYQIQHQRDIDHGSHAIVGSQTWGAFPWMDETWGGFNYYVSDVWIRDYREYRVGVRYIGQYWDNADRTWANAGASWSGFNVLITSSHTQS